MHRLLASGFREIIEMLALAIVGGGALAGYVLGQNHAAGLPRLAMAAIGGFCGFIIAVLVCGPLAVMIQIERHLSVLKNEVGDLRSAAETMKRSAAPET